MYRPLNATRKKNMAQKLHDKDSSDEDEIFNKEPGYLIYGSYIKWGNYGKLKCPFAE